MLTMDQWFEQNKVQLTQEFNLGNADTTSMNKSGTVGMQNFRQFQKLKYEEYVASQQMKTPTSSPTSTGYSTGPAPKQSQETGLIIVYMEDGKVSSLGGIPAGWTYTVVNEKEMQKNLTLGIGDKFKFNENFTKEFIIGRDQDTEVFPPMKMRELHKNGAEILDMIEGEDDPMIDLGNGILMAYEYVREFIDVSTYEPSPHKIKPEEKEEEEL